MRILYRRLDLWFRIVGRENWTDHLTGPILAWQMCCIVHPYK
jgi:hypothetical protein